MVSWDDGIVHPSRMRENEKHTQKVKAVRAAEPDEMRSPAKWLWQ